VSFRDWFCSNNKRWKDGKGVFWLDLQKVTWVLGCEFVAAVNHTVAETERAGSLAFFGGGKMNAREGISEDFHVFVIHRHFIFPFHFFWIFQYVNLSKVANMKIINKKVLKKSWNGWELTYCIENIFSWNFLYFCIFLGNFYIFYIFLFCSLIYIYDRNRGVEIKLRQTIYYFVLLSTSSFVILIFYLIYIFFLIRDLKHED
jgi:hypothetical protein